MKVWFRWFSVFNWVIFRCHVSPFVFRGISDVYHSISQRFGQSSFKKGVSHPMWWIRPKLVYHQLWTVWGRVVLLQKHHFETNIPWKIVQIYLNNFPTPLQCQCQSPGQKKKTSPSTDTAAGTSRRWHLGDTPVTCFLTTIAPQSPRCSWLNRGEKIPQRHTLTDSHHYVSTWATKKTRPYFPLYWLFNRDPYNGLLWSP